MDASELTWKLGARLGQLLRSERPHRFVSRHDSLARRVDAELGDWLHSWPILSRKTTVLDMPVFIAGALVLLTQTGHYGAHVFHEAPFDDLTVRWGKKSDGVYPQRSFWMTARKWPSLQRALADAATLRREALQAMSPLQGTEIGAEQPSDVAAYLRWAGFDADLDDSKLASLWVGPGRVPTEVIVRATRRPLDTASEHAVHAADALRPVADLLQAAGFTTRHRAGDLLVRTRDPKVMAASARRARALHRQIDPRR